MRGADLVYTDQHPLGLQLTLMEGYVDLSQFTILSTEVIEREEFRITGGIIGASHFLAFEMEGRRFTEVFACVPAEGEHKVYHAPIREIPDIVHITVGGLFCYTFECYMVPWQVGETQRDRMVSGSPEPDMPLFTEKKLRYEFPHVGRDALRAKLAETILTLRANQKGVRAETLHTYPNHESMVFTHSFFERTSI